MPTPTRELGDAYIEIDGSVVSEQGNKVALKDELQAEDATGFRADYEQTEYTLGKASIDVTLFLNFGTGSINALLGEIYRERKVVEVAIKPKKGLASIENPKWVLKAAKLGSNPREVTGPKKLLTVSVTFENAGQTGIEEITTSTEGEAE